MNNDEHNKAYDMWFQSNIIHNAIMEVLQSGLTTKECIKIIEDTLTRSLAILKEVDKQHP